ncbi:LysR family transcriptional regulator [Deinococcus irradiatisoli]|uniref:LysR family transcriptional regulator n=1 Tax=Deinococcus irradiatisoli TaxID=2202254 RepID=A0A2Z3JHC2_9DEIO|nr:LysR family transcriptional regulator [Deinococcus irradiatisoli]AWN23436.1 LysR family transcriptional regulator [Deinococcus irradiatisoli]
MDTAKSPASAPPVEGGRPAITLAQLRLFTAVVDEGSFSAAAAALGMSQSSLSEGVRALEAALGQSVLLRTRSGVSLTPTGQRVIGHARDALMAVQDLHLSADPARTLSGQLIVATYRSIGQQLLAPALARLHTRHPELHIRIIDAGRDGQGGQRFVRSGEADVGLIEAPDEAGLLFEALLHDPYVAVVPAGQAGTLTWERLKSQPLLLPPLSGPAYRPVLDFLRRHQALSANITEVDEDDVILSMVEYGLGITIFPRLALGGLKPSLSVAALPEPLERVIGLVIRPGRATLPHVQALTEAVRAQVGERPKRQGS